MERFAHAALYVLIAGAAWTYARTNPAHRVIAALFAWELTANTARLLVTPAIDAAAQPYSGGALALYSLDHALVLSFRFAMLAACLAHFERRPITLAIHGFGATILALVLFKETTDSSLVPFHHAVAAITVLICWVLALRAVLAPASRLQDPDGAHAALLLILAVALVKVSLHYFHSTDERWDEVRWADLLVYGLIALAYVGALAHRYGGQRWRA